MPIRKLRMGTYKFPSPKRGFFRKIKAIEGLRGGVLMVRRTRNPED